MGINSGACSILLTISATACGYNDTKHPVSRCHQNVCREPPADTSTDASDEHWRQWWKHATERVCTEASPVSCKSSRVATVVTWADRAYRENPVVQASLTNRQIYCQRHGLRWVIDDAAYTATPYFNKPYALKAALLAGRPNEYVLWADADVLFTNLTASIDDVVDAARLRTGSQCDIIAADDGNGVYGAGLILIRRSCYAVRWLDHWYALRRWMRVEGDQAGYIVAVLHGILGYDWSVDEDKKRFLPCVYLDGPYDDLISCVRRSLRRKAGNATSHYPRQQQSFSSAGCPGSLCLTRGFNTKINQWTPSSLLFHAQGRPAKRCLQAMAVFATKPDSSARLISRKRTCFNRERTLCSAFGFALCIIKAHGAHISVSDEENRSAPAQNLSASRITFDVEPRHSGEQCQFDPARTLPVIPPKQPSPCSASTVSYHPSTWEQWWSANIGNLMLNNWKWQLGCNAMRCMRPAVTAWLQLSKRARRGAVAWPADVFSHHRVVSACAHDANRLLHIEPIEPLVGILRHPQSHCLEKCPPCKHSGSKDYLILPSYGVIGSPKRGHRRTFLFDLGASLYRSGLGGSSQDWFVEQFARHNVTFERIFAWEPKPSPPRAIFNAMPKAIYDITSYFNIGVDAEEDSKLNPLRTLLAITVPRDYVVLKIDIDSVEIETKLLEQIITRREISSRIDELFYEDHVRGHPFMHGGPWSADVNRTGRTIADSYAQFSELRRLGVRAHSWV